MISTQWLPVRAEKETPGGDAAATNRVAMANARVEAELCSCGREQCQTCNWERDWSQEVVRAAYRSLEEHKERAKVQRGGLSCLVGCLES